MTPTDPTRLGPVLRTGLLSCVLSAALVACGGGAGPSADLAAANAVPASTPTAQAVRSLTPLLDDDGNLVPSDPSAVPSDPAARTRAGRYATEAQAHALEVALDQRVLRTVVEPQANQADAVALAVYLTYALQAAHDLPSSTPVLVHGADARLVAIVADRLADDGFTRVVAVTR